MNTQALFSVLRTILIAFGAFLIGKNFFGSVLDASIWEQLVGAVLSIGTMVYSFIKRESTIEGFQTTIRGVLVFIGGLLVTAGKITGATLETVLGIFTIIGPHLYGWLSRKKTEGLVNGTVRLETLKGGK